MDPGRFCLIFGNRFSWTLASIVHYGSLLTALLYVLYAALVLPLFDYHDVVWSLEADYND